MLFIRHFIFFLKASSPLKLKKTPAELSQFTPQENILLKWPEKISLVFSLSSPQALRKLLLLSPSLSSNALLKISLTAFSKAKPLSHSSLFLSFSHPPPLSSTILLSSSRTLPQKILCLVLSFFLPQALCSLWKTLTLRFSLSLKKAPPAGDAPPLTERTHLWKFPSRCQPFNGSFNSTTWFTEGQLRGNTWFLEIVTPVQN